MILVDTTIWSLVLRRRPDRLSPPEQKLVRHWADLADEGLVAVAGPIRQEVLTGIRHPDQFRRLVRALDAFHCVPVTTADYDRAAEYFNTCRQHGIVGGDIDMLICSLAVASGSRLFTADDDFTRYARHVPVKLYTPTD